MIRSGGTKINKETGEIVSRAGAAATAQSSPVQSRPVSSRLTLDEAREKAEKQLCDGLQGRDLFIMREGVSVLAEVYMMPDEYTLMINGEPLKLDIIKDVMAHLTPEMALYAIDRANRMTVRYNRRSLVRVMLYNEVFEYDGHVAQEVADILPIGHGKV